MLEIEHDKEGMILSLEQLLGEKRLLLEAEMEPQQGERFQPTGFPELGPATYTLPDGTEMLLVESSQSTANRMEAICWDSTNKELVEPLQGIPYVRVMYEGEELTNSILEAHRLNSSYILRSEDTSFFEQLQSELRGLEVGPVDERVLAQVVLKYDPNALLHGIFFARKELAGGRLRLPRLLSGFIEARDVRPAESGGVKNDRVEPRANPQIGFGNVPYARTEYVAGSITGYFNLDLQRLRSYNLDKTAEIFLVALAIWKVRKFLDAGLRLRTACDLCCKGVTVKFPDSLSLLGTNEIEEVLPLLIKETKGFAEPPITEINFVPPKNWRKAAEDESEEEGLAE